MTVIEAAKQLGVSPATVSNLLIAQKLKGTKGPREGSRIKIWNVTEQDLTAYQLTRKKYTRKKKPGPAPSVNGHNHNSDRTPQIRRVIDEWIDALPPRISLGELTRNQIQELAHRVKRVA